MNKDEYLQRKQELRKKYAEDLLDLERKWLADFPAEMMEVDFENEFPEISKTRRAEIAIERMDGEFTLNDVQVADYLAYPGFSRFSNQLIGNILSRMRSLGEVKVVRPRTKSKPAIFRTR